MLISWNEDLLLAGSIYVRDLQPSQDDLIPFPAKNGSFDDLSRSIFCLYIPVIDPTRFSNLLSEDLFTCRKFLLAFHLDNVSCIYTSPDGLHKILPYARLYLTRL